MMTRVTSASKKKNASKASSSQSQTKVEPIVMPIENPVEEENPISEDENEEEKEKSLAEDNAFTFFGNRETSKKKASDLPVNLTKEQAETLSRLIENQIRLIGECHINPNRFTNLTNILNQLLANIKKNEIDPKKSLAQTLKLLKNILEVYANIPHNMKDIIQTCFRPDNHLKCKKLNKNKDSVPNLSNDNKRPLDWFAFSLVYTIPDQNSTIYEFHMFELQMYILTSLIITSFIKDISPEHHSTMSKSIINALKHQIEYTFADTSKTDAIARSATIAKTSTTLTNTNPKFNRPSFNPIKLSDETVTEKPKKKNGKKVINYDMNNMSEQQKADLVSSQDKFTSHMANLKIDKGSSSFSNRKIGKIPLNAIHFPSDGDISPPKPNSPHKLIETDDEDSENDINDDENNIDDDEMENTMNNSDESEDA